MDILVLNGSPRGTQGATWWVLERFLKGVEEAGGKATTIHLARRRIHHCTGEFSCWFKTPGRCLHHDDMEEILIAAREARALVLATPVYVDGMTGLLKSCLDRMLPIADPHFELRDDHCRHPSRNAAGIAQVALVSVCGFFELDNFDPLVTHVQALCRNFGANYAGAVLRPGGPLLPEIPTIHPLFFKIRAVSKAIEQAGREFVHDGKISADAQSAASADIVAKDKYLSEANRWFDEQLAKRQKSS